MRHTYDTRNDCFTSHTSDVTQKTTGNDRIESEVPAGIPAPGRFLPLSQSEFLRNFEPSLELTHSHIISPLC